MNYTITYLIKEKKNDKMRAVEFFSKTIYDYPQSDS